MTARHSGDDGSISLEIVIVAPLLIMLLLLVVGFARVAQANTTVDSAAYAAARAASISRGAGQASTSARAAAQGVLDQEGLKCPASVDVDTSGFATEPGQSASVNVTVTCPVPLGDLSVPGLPGTRVVTSDASSVIDTYRGRD